jgi:hypothetical protein
LAFAVEHEASFAAYHEEKSQLRPIQASTPISPRLNPDNSTSSARPARLSEDEEGSFSVLAIGKYAQSRKQFWSEQNLIDDDEPDERAKYELGVLEPAPVRDGFANERPCSKLQKWGSLIKR